MHTWKRCRNGDSQASAWPGVCSLHKWLALCKKLKNNLVYRELSVWGNLWSGWELCIFNWANIRREKSMFAVPLSLPLQHVWVRRAWIFPQWQMHSRPALCSDKSHFKLWSDVSKHSGAPPHTFARNSQKCRPWSLLCKASPARLCCAIWELLLQPKHLFSESSWEFCFFTESWKITFSALL